MTSPPLCLTGKITHSDAATLRDQALAQIENGSLEISASDLESIDFGAVQVLLCAAIEARSLGLPCQLDKGGALAIDPCLAAVHLPDTAAFFTIVPTAEVSAPS